MRGLAIAILDRVDRGGAYADILLDRSLRAETLPDPRDRALLTELVMGTLRRRGMLDHAVAARLPRPLDRTDPFVRNALRAGAYQLYFTRIPERAALFETVEAVKERRGERSAGFVNAVLRALAREGRETPLPPEGDPGRDAARLSAPPPLLSALEASLGGPETERFLIACLDKPPFAIRTNPFRTSREALLARLAGAGMAPVPCRFAPDGIVLGEPGRVHADEGFRSGEYQAMDEGAQLIAPLLAPAPGERILDACAAPGGKATHLSALAGGLAAVTAADLSPGRLRQLKETVARTGAPGIEAVAHDFAKGPLPGRDEAFDKVLVDAPCTGMGVIRRNPDAKWRFRPADPARMAELQGAILESAWRSLRPGGLLVYCTCTPLREEGDDVVGRFLEKAGGGPRVVHPGDGWPGPADARTPGGFVRLAPHLHDTDGFFAALLRKTG